MIMDKSSKLCGLYILDGSSINNRASLTIKYSHDNKNLMDLSSRHGRYLEDALVQFNEFCMKQGIKT